MSSKTQLITEQSMRMMCRDHKPFFFFISKGFASISYRNIKRLMVRVKDKVKALN